MRQSKYAWIAFATTAGLLWVGSVQAQPVTGTPTLSNIPTAMSATYGDWTNTATSPATITDTATGFEVYAPMGADDGGGSGYYDIAVGNRQILNMNDTIAVLTFTVNDTNTESTMWVGVPIVLVDNVTNYGVGGYVGEFNGYFGTQSPGYARFVTNANNTMTITETIDLPAALIATIKAGGDSINGINLEYYPALYGTDEYDITYNSLVLLPGLAITSSKYNAATSQVTLSWTSQASATYTVQYSTNLLSGFTPLATNIPSGGTNTTDTVTVPAGNTGFFQILQQ
jgi:hypothetical protein